MDEVAKERSQIKRHLRSLEQESIRRRDPKAMSSEVSEMEASMALKLIESEIKKLRSRLIELGDWHGQQ
jgi:hypothetical protein